LIPGVDGLIHISQLSDRNVNNVAEVVRVGDVVNVKITDINYETKKVSLSIRALLHSEDTAVEDT
ncbi:MAG TPA: 30S ribosomal protein S1, partial [Clostridiales bacterium]|nr:30S ribosomal protein S1 [Clostridiales bacterium]